jgi:hypothetical protein
MGESWRAPDLRQLQRAHGDPLLTFVVCAPLRALVVRKSSQGKDNTMQTTPKTEAEARSASRRVMLSGWHEARIVHAHEALSKRGNDMIEISVAVVDAEDRTFRDWLTDTPLGGLKLRHACEAVGALERYDSGEIGAEDFPEGHTLRIKIGIEKKRGYPDREVIEDYAASSASVVTLRSAG